MKEILHRYPEVVDKSKRAVQASGMVYGKRPVGGGTDGARFCLMGVPGPNLFAGAMRVHSKTEWIPVVALERASEVIVRLCRYWCKAS